MSAAEQLRDDDLDEFDQAEAAVDFGTPWRYREPGAPNPLTIKATGWSSGHTRLGPAEFLRGSDRDGRKWSVLVGGAVLTKALLDGLIEEWDDELGAHRVVDTLGPVAIGEVVSIKYVGDKAASSGFEYPDFKISRVRPQPRDPVPDRTPNVADNGSYDDYVPDGEWAPPPSDDDIPF